MADLVEFLVDDGWHVTFAADSLGNERYARQLQQKGVRTVVGAERIEDLVKAGDFDLALIFFWQIAERYIPLLRRHSPRARIVVDSIDLHFLRVARGAFLDSPPGAFALCEGEGEMFVRELNAYSAADAVLTVSHKEAAIVDDFLAQPGHAAAVPDCEHRGRSPIPFADRRGILFVGNFAHPPNVGAVEFLCDEIAPLVNDQLLHDHPISVVGNALDDRIRRTCERAGVAAVGWVPSVQPYLDCTRVSVVPLLYGAGTKRKLIQALWAGTPTVSTSTGVEGLDLTSGTEVLVADEAPAFAAAIERLIEDEHLWSSLADAGRSRIEETHGRASVQDRFRNVVEDILSVEPRAFTPLVRAKTHDRAPLPARPYPLPGDPSSDDRAVPPSLAPRGPLREVRQRLPWVIKPTRANLRRLKTYRALDRSAEFDRGFYYRSYADVARSGIDPLRHYIDQGWKEGRNPNSSFNSSAYLARHPDVAAAGVNPLLHYIQHGRIEDSALAGDGR
jgi:glycosyltransferase involved in cell wall biosynthesis